MTGNASHAKAFWTPTHFAKLTGGVWLTPPNEPGAPITNGMVRPAPPTHPERAQ